MAPEDCLFCRLVREGDHVHAADGFVAIRDIAPKAPIHLLELPERHVDTFREVGEFPPDWKPRKESGRPVYSIAEEEGTRFLRAAENAAIQIAWKHLGK